jgi:hypothetical protein
MTQQKNKLLIALNNFRNLVIDIYLCHDLPDNAPISVYYKEHQKDKAYQIIDRNITSIEKQIKKL